MENSTPPSSLRHLLREATSIAHAQLDAQVGLFDSTDSYGRYLQGTAAFRQATESEMRHSIWQPASLYPLLMRDLEDLSLCALSPVPHEAGSRNPDFLLGAAYVLEGSGLGARLLVRRAETIGFNDQFGARHLVAQASDRDSWPRFLDILSHVSPERFDDIILGAQETFDFAMMAYAGERV